MFLESRDVVVKMKQTFHKHLHLRTVRSTEQTHTNNHQVWVARMQYSHNTLAWHCIALCSGYSVQQSNNAEVLQSCNRGQCPGVDRCEHWAQLVINMDNRHRVEMELNCLVLAPNYV